MSFINFIFENVVYAILFMSLLFMFVKCKGTIVKIVFSLMLFLYFSAFAIYTYIFAVGKISKKIRAGEDMIRSPMDEVVQVIQKVEN